MLYAIPTLKCKSNISNKVIFTCYLRWFQHIIPCKKQWLIKIILYIDNNIPICSDIKNRSRKLPINPNNLQNGIQRKKGKTKSLNKTSRAGEKVKNSYNMKNQATIDFLIVHNSTIGSKLKLKLQNSLTIVTI